jgi:ATP-binding cassette subfamily C (CFTR/MRP) protein 1
VYTQDVEGKDGQCPINYHPTSIFFWHNFFRDRPSLALVHRPQVILPCHAVSFLRFADHIISLGDTRILEQGTYRNLLSRDGDFTDLMAQHANIDADDTAVEPEPEETQEAQPAVADKVVAKKDEKDGKITTVGKNSKTKIVAGKTKIVAGKTLIVAEARDKGGVKGDVYGYYAGQVGIPGVIFVMCCFAFGQAVKVFADWWMSRWAVLDMNLVPSDNWSPLQITAWFLSFYFGSGVFIVIFTVLKVLIIQIIGFKASRKIHQKLLWRLMKAPVKYFDVTPVSYHPPTRSLISLVLR